MPQYSYGCKLTTRHLKVLIYFQFYWHNFWYSKAYVLKKPGANCVTLNPQKQMH